MSNGFEVNEGSSCNSGEFDCAGSPDVNLATLVTNTKELAKFGTYVTNRVDISYNEERAAHPSDEHRFRTLNPITGDEMELTDFFSKEDVYSAMMENKDVKEALRDSHMNPKNFDELNKVLSSSGSGIPISAEMQEVDLAPTGGSDWGDNAYLNDKALSNFAFKQVIADHDEAFVETRLLLDYGATPFANTLPYVDLILPMNERLMGRLAKADSLQDGFLMKDSDQMGTKTSKTQRIPEYEW